ncbi:MAG: carbohydrate binding domain-containing protein [Bacteroidales bacterium]|nr:carbohydrate binding domain-containing protein [Bacteroidales bacterium]MCM1147065.1 carbohydrate binding domain-containing protein [Bacteroidales bacterium]MCM1205802.1 carbohydrate binding domain-containing protein [Bacillota bacterium]MCM1509955.1 carbohydrate binding domain-containing protein [Clostridium sp.]
MMNKFVLSLLTFFSFPLLLYAQDAVLSIEPRHKVCDISKTMYGVFFEDINYGADGGLYAEMVKNRSFEFPQALMGWKTIGGVEVRDDGPFPRCPHYVRMSYSGKRDMPTAIENEGFLSMSFHGGERYRFSCWTRVVNATSAKMSVHIRDVGGRDDGRLGKLYQVVCDTVITVEDQEWHKVSVTFTVPQTVEKAALSLSLPSKGNGTDVSLNVEHVSLMPVSTWNNRENGMRRDLVQHLAALKPGVFRFPGGCIVEGATLDTRYNWKNSVGPVENRPVNENRWNYDMRNTRYDYYQSYGLGFFEFFQLCEDLGCEPLPVLSCGMACQFNNDWRHDGPWLAKGDSLDEFIQDAVDLIEFCNGDPGKNRWARLRAEMGHQEPFCLKYLAIGNEQWGEYYPPRLEAFMRVISKQYPEVTIIGSAGPSASGDEFDRMWGEMRRLDVSLVDEHYYKDADFFLSSAKRYDTYPRRGPKVFAGEYACHDRGKKFNHYFPAICEAAFMTGLERNADIVRMATYAPLFAHVDGWQWRPDMIWFDNLRSVCSSSYYVQQMFACNRGTNVIPATIDGKPVTGQDSLYVSATVDRDDNNAIILKVVNAGSSPRSLSIDIKGKRKYGKVITTRFSCDRPSEERDEDNTLEHPIRFVPVTSQPEIFDNKITVSSLSFNIYRIL